MGREPNLRDSWKVAPLGIFWLCGGQGRGSHSGELAEIRRLHWAEGRRSRRSRGCSGPRGTPCRRHLRAPTAYLPVAVGAVCGRCNSSHGPSGSTPIARNIEAS